MSKDTRAAAIKLRARFKQEKSEDNAIRCAGSALLAFNSGHIDDTELAAVLRDVADWLDSPSDNPGHP